MKTVQVSRRSASYRRRLLAAGALSAVVALSYVDFAYALPLNCDASAAPANGGVGDCTNSLASGSTCQPVCNAGYTVSGTSSCSAGTLTAATCSADSAGASTPIAVALAAAAVPLFL